jgi:uncharacterized protein with HEPN domain
MRDVLIHEYFGVDLGVIWRIVEDEVPDLLLVPGRLIDVSMGGGRRLLIPTRIQP